jgi:hypothetical protein
MLYVNLYYRLRRRFSRDFLCSLAKSEIDEARLDNSTDIRAC